MTHLDDVDLKFDVQDNRNRFTFVTLGEYNAEYAATLAGYLDAATVRSVSNEAVKWVLSRLWRVPASPPP